MSEDGEGEEERTPSPQVDNKDRTTQRPRRAAALRIKRSAAAAAAAAATTEAAVAATAAASSATPPPVPAKYREELNTVDREILQILHKGIPPTDVLSNREEYIKMKKAMEVPEGEEEAEGEGEQPNGP
ncbi:hypothetical protein, conserved [Eimeria praecox]|uniref:Uncharacterized protein n=1 Tax=Eimeria praecox TaxID=51316 RepID=U6H380_9EIME|nr:hypothetical protein, conserved [Eimeria praecox]